MAVSVVQTDVVFDQDDLTTYTFTGVAIGTATSDRLVSICISSIYTGTDAASISSVTIGGVSATIDVEETSTTSVVTLGAIATAEVPTGTTATVVITLNRQASRLALIAYAVTGAKTTPSAVASAASTTATVSTTITIQANGAAIGAYSSSSNFVFGSLTWGGLTFDAQATGYNSISCASDEFATLQTARTISGENPFSSAPNTLTVVAFEEAGAAGTVVTLVSDSFTLTEGVLSVNAEIIISLSSDSLLISGGVLTIAQDLGTVVTLTPDTFTLDAGTLIIRPEIETRITLVPVIFTISKGTLNIRVEQESRVSLSPKSFAINNGVLSVSQPKTITLLSDSFTLTNAVMSVFQGEFLVIPSGGMLAAKHVRKTMSKR